MKKTDCCAIFDFSHREGPGGSLSFVREILFTPCAVWLADALGRCGVERIYVIGPVPEEVLSLMSGVEVSPAEDWAGAADAAARQGHTWALAFPEGEIMTEKALDALVERRSHAVRLLDSKGRRSAALGCSVQDLVAYVGRKPAETETLPGYFWAASDPAQREEAGLYLRDMACARHRAGGVEFIDSRAVYITPGVTIGAGTVVLPGTILRGRTAVGQGCLLGPNTVIVDCMVGDACTINSSQLYESTVGSGVNMGPFAYVRPGCEISDNVKIGDFVELKKAEVGPGTKIPHLSYVGDAKIGASVNIGCGAITVNYDGKFKHLTEVGDGAFIGCNTNLVAPVKVGAGAYTAAGSTITQEVSPDALAIARERQSNKEGWAGEKRRQGKIK